MGETQYIEDVVFLGDNDVVFIEKKTGRKLVRRFSSPYLAKEFVRKLRHSKKCLLVSYPTWH